VRLRMQMMFLSLSLLRESAKRLLAPLATPRNINRDRNPAGGFYSTRHILETLPMSGLSTDLGTRLIGKLLSLESDAPSCVKLSCFIPLRFSVLSPFFSRFQRRSIACVSFRYSSLKILIPSFFRRLDRKAPRGRGRAKAVAILKF